LDAGDDVVMTNTQETAGGVVTVQTIEEIAGVVPQRLIERLLEACQVGGKGGLYSRVGPVVEDVIAEGWSAGGIINQVLISLYERRLAYSCSSSTLGFMFSLSLCVSLFLILCCPL
jgi:hypothetical protein